MQDSSLWQAVLGEIELSVSRANYITWFKNTKLIKRKGASLVVGVQNVFVKQQLERKYNQLIIDVLAKNGVNPENIDYKIHSNPDASKRMYDEPLVLSTPNNLIKQATTTLTHSYRQGLNEKYTFDNFIVGSGSELAYAACQAIAANTIRCFCTAAVVLAKPTLSKLSATPCWPKIQKPRWFISLPSNSFKNF